MEEDVAVTTSPKKKYSSKNANNRIADDFINNPIFSENLIYFKSYACFFMYTDNKYYRKLDTRDMQKIVLRFCETNYGSQGFTASQVTDIISLVTLKVIREYEREQGEYIAFDDCLYNTRTHTTEVFSREKLVTLYLPYNTNDLNLPTPIFNKFLSTSLVQNDGAYTPDTELSNLVQEMFGFTLLNTNYATGAFFLYGAGANGKSVLLNIIEHIFGEDYVSAMSLSDFSKPFAVGDIINKRVNISNEEDERYVSGKMFKVLVTGESLRGEHKFGAGYKMRASCKFLFSTNKLPTFDGLDYGLKRRIFIIPFYRKFNPSEQDKGLFDKLKDEIPGILGWALEGARRLSSNNYVFSRAKSCDTVFAEFEEEMSSAIMFYNENYETSEHDRCNKQTMYESYVQWCKDNGKRGVSSSRKFNKDLLENIHGLKDGLVSSQGGNSFRAFNCTYSPREQRNLPPPPEEMTPDDAFVI